MTKGANTVGQCISINMHRYYIPLALVVTLVMTAAAPLRLRAQRTEPAPEALSGVGVDEQLSAPLPLSLTFRDERGRQVALGEYFTDRPVILTLNYAECPMLCQLQLQGLVETLRQLDWSVGNEFHIVTVSIDPAETPQRAQLAKNQHVRAYGRPATASGWHFLTGDEPQIRKLADAVGFRYRYIADRREYAHAAVVMACTPSGRISRYLYGVEYSPQTLRLSLVEAGEGKIGSTLDRVLLFCFHYDAAAGRYAPAAQRLMKWAGAVTVLMVAGSLAPYWLRRRRSTATAPAQGSSAAFTASAGSSKLPTSQVL